MIVAPSHKYGLRIARTITVAFGLGKLGKE